MVIFLEQSKTTDPKQYGPWIYYSETQINTGADVTVIPEPLYLQTGIPNLQKSSRQLFGRGRSKLSVKGVIKGNLKNGNGKRSTHEIHAVENLKEPLLGRPAIDALNLVQKVDTIHSDDSARIEQEVKTMFPNLFKGLGELEGEFNIKLTPRSTPYAVTTPRRVAHRVGLRVGVGQRRATENGKTWRHFKS